MNDQVFDRIANTGPSTLCRYCDFSSHFRVTVLVEVEVAYSLVVLDYGNPAILRHKPDQSFSATGDDAMNVLVQSEQMIEGYPVSGGDQLNGIFGQFSAFEGRSNNVG